MKTLYFLITAALFVLSGFANAQVQYDCNRIVTLSPSLTEVAYAVGLGDKLVGVSDYSDFPEQARSVARVGGFLDPNLELILKLKPSLVLLLSEFRDRIAQFEKLGLKTLVFEHRKVSGILGSIKKLGDACDVSLPAEKLLTELNHQITNIKKLVVKRAPVSVLIVLGEGGGTQGVRTYYLSGSDGFYSDILQIVGAQNVVQASTFGAPTVSAEGVIALNPEVIINIDSSVSKFKDPAEARKMWQNLGLLRAVRDQRVYFFSQDYAVVPGPRFIQLACEMLQVLHQDLKCF